MTLPAGSRVGAYEILGPLGAGGMGEVYRARDTKLQREIAIKILPHEFALDRDRLARFEREAQILAALNHPNIAGIYGLDEHGGRKFLVLELVAGDTLADRLSRGAIPIDEAIEIARQLSFALEAAHDKGIVHRDLKPANIKITPDGTVKVLDFGLAKDLARSAAGLDLSASPTFTAHGTQLGVILGTAAYMSPEQARGKPVDKRADIWAFGCVLYEMLTGRAPVAGETITDILGAIVHKEIDWSALPAKTPSSLRRVLRRCLEKDLRGRLRDIGDARIELEDADITAASPTAQPRRAWNTWAVIIPLAALLVGLAAGSWWRPASSDSAHDEWRGTRLGGPSESSFPRISPDGRLIAFEALVDGLSQIAVMKPDTGNWTLLTHDRTHGLASALAWSADGAKIYYDRWTDSPVGIFSVPALGGEERLVLDNAGLPIPLPDGSLVVIRINDARNAQLYRFWPANGKLQALPAVLPSAIGGDVDPVKALPGGREVVFLGQPLGRPQAGLYVMNLESSETRPFTYSQSKSAAYAESTGLAVHPGKGTIFITGPDGDRFRLFSFESPSAPPHPVMEFEGAPTVDISADGRLYVSLQHRPVQILRAAASGGAAEPFAHSPMFQSHGIAPLPDGRVLVRASAGGHVRILVAAAGREPTPLVDTAEDTSSPMTPIDAGHAALAIGSAENREVAIVSIAEGRIVRRLKAPIATALSLAASPDGKTLYFDNDRSIWALSVEGGTPKKLCTGDSVAVDPQTGDLIVKLDEQNRFRLKRVPPGGGDGQTISIRGDLRLVARPLSPGAVRNSTLLVPAASTDSWFWFVGAVDLKTGELNKIPLSPLTDIHFATWSPDGRILAAALGFSGEMWRFDRVSK